MSTECKITYDDNGLTITLGGEVRTPPPGNTRTVGGGEAKTMPVGAGLGQYGMIAIVLAPVMTDRTGAPIPLNMKTFGLQDVTTRQARKAPGKRAKAQTRKAAEES